MLLFSYFIICFILFFHLRKCFQILNFHAFLNGEEEVPAEQKSTKLGLYPLAVFTEVLFIILKYISVPTLKWTSRKVLALLKITFLENFVKLQAKRSPEIGSPNNSELLVYFSILFVS